MVASPLETTRAPIASPTAGRRVLPLVRPLTLPKAESDLDGTRRRLKGPTRFYPAHLQMPLIGQISLLAVPSIRRPTEARQLCAQRFSESPSLAVDSVYAAKSTTGQDLRRITYRRPYVQPQTPAYYFILVSAHMMGFPFNSI